MEWFAKVVHIYGKSELKAFIERFNTNLDNAIKEYGADKVGIERWSDECVREMLNDPRNEYVIPLTREGVEVLEGTYKPRYYNVDEKDNVKYDDKYYTARDLTNDFIELMVGRD